MEKMGKVWLVGAGPGDAGLLTVRGSQILEQAEVVVYDALIQLEILCQIPPQAKKINVGKRAGNHSVPQEEINNILLQEAMEGKQVVRLKGGDPFVFGRGGEELELLVQHQIPFEIVPGIPSAVAVPAYAGIPVTHRRETSSFHVITGHNKKNGASQIDYEALVRLGGTLIFLMGVASMKAICENLIQAGMEKEMPAAVLERGTTAKQRRIISTVEHLSEEAEKGGIQAPAIIIVGNVCRLSEEYHWETYRSLGQKQVAVTRARDKSSKMAEKLRMAGAHVIELPMIETAVKENHEVFFQAVQEICKEKEQECWIVLTSPSGTDIFFEQLAKCQIDLRCLLAGNQIPKFAVVGNSTAKALKRHGIYPDLIPEQFSGRDLGECLVQNLRQNSRIYLFRASKADTDLPQILEKVGFVWKEVPIYDTVYQTNMAWKTQLEEMLQNKEIDYVTFTSASTVRAFIQVMGKMDYSLVSALCIGEKTAAEARKYGMRITVSQKATMESMIEEIIKE